MVPRQKLETLHDDHKNKFQVELNRFNFLQGQVSEAVKPKRKQALQAEANATYALVMKLEGAVQVLAYQIGYCDLEEGEFEIIDRMRLVDETAPV